MEREAHFLTVTYDNWHRMEFSRLDYTYFRLVLRQRLVFKKEKIFHQR